MRAWILVVLLAVVAAACGPAEASGTPEINLGRDLCMECGMVIDDARFAASYRLSDGTEKVFDDIGGLIVQGRETGELDQAQVWVADFQTTEMLEAASAFFVPTLAVASPMGHGLLAFGDEARAHEVAGAMDGDVLDWSVVAALPVVDGLVGHHHHVDEMDEVDGQSMDDHEMEHSG